MARVGPAFPARLDRHPRWLPDLPTLRGLHLHLHTIALSGPAPATTNGFEVRLY